MKLELNAGSVDFHQEGGFNVITIKDSKGNVFYGHSQSGSLNEEQTSRTLDNYYKIRQLVGGLEHA